MAVKGGKKWRDPANRTFGHLFQRASVRSAAFRRHHDDDSQQQQQQQACLPLGPFRKN